MTMLKLLRSLATITAAAAALCGGVGSSASQDMKIRVGIGIDMSHAEWPLIVDKDFGRRHGLKVEIKPFDTGAGGLDAVMSGQMDIAVVSELAGLNAASKRGNIVGLARPWYSGKVGGLAVSKDIKKPEDLIGKTIAVHPATGSEFFYRFFFARKHGLEGKVNVVNVPVPEQLTALLRGDIQAASTWYPWLARLPGIVPGGHILETWEGAGYKSQHTMWVSKRFAAENKAAVVAFLKTTRDAIDWANASRDNWKEMATIAAKAFRIPEDTALAQLDQQTFTLDLSDELMADMVTAAKFGNQAKVLDIADPEKFVPSVYDASFIKEAAPDRLRVK